MTHPSILEPSGANRSIWAQKDGPFDAIDRRCFGDSNADNTIGKSKSNYHLSRGGCSKKEDVSDRIANHDK